ncbi:hypothetical protein COT48_06045 [Candidatus Woesearchaeota archaeon CG08_land_8_20_14_0_20_47_9]|nr:MAG: hypothetical protein COV22_00610 [Candidatus Woesearchaeota archaeon CG10_big_fil_rev_8_21_14_0_10_47_5]PIO03141.1 MAG: hypothetical protein COT48_06045 [Candidatus Woesearchaeota archaeon CG08_land_8_20_14_0_20_47_9]HII29743.1 hypothetical protein [Candidatus Woesearchaeota archaeon]
MNSNNNAKASDASVTLTVAEAIQMDVGRGIARIGSGYMKKLGVSAGDAVS